MAHYDLATAASTASNPGISTGHIIHTNYHSSARVAGSGGDFKYTGTTTLANASSWPNADGYFYDVDGKQFGLEPVDGEISVLPFGAVPATNCSAAFKAIQAYATALGGGHIVVPYHTSGYIVGDGTDVSAGSALTGVELTSNTHWNGCGNTITHGATTSGGNYLFDLQDVRNVSVSGFVIDGQAVTQASQARIGIAMRGTIEDVYISNIHLFDHANHAIQYGDVDTVAATSYIRNLHISKVRIDGITGATGAGSGINLFPRAEISNEPSSKNVWITDCWFDSSNNDAAAVGSHGPQGLKVNNVDGLYLDNVYARGGDVAAIVITNGCRNVRIGSVHTAFADIGMAIGTDSNVVVGKTYGVTVASFSYDADGVATGNGYGLWLTGDIGPFHADSVQCIGGDLVIETEDPTDDQRNFSFGKVTLINGNFSVSSEAAPANDFIGLSVDSIHVTGLATGGNARVALAPTNRSIVACRIGSIVGQGTDNDLLSISGSDNKFGSVLCIDGNPDSDANAWVVSDAGDNNTFESIGAIGAANNMTNWYNASGGSYNGRVKEFLGSVSDASGVRCANLSGGLASGTIKVISRQIDLSGAAVDNVEFYADDADYWIISALIYFTEASSADAGVAVRVGNASSTTAYLSSTSTISAAIGDEIQRMNTTGTGSFATRKLTKGDYMTIGTAGGKVGTGEVRVNVNLVRAA